MKRIIRCTVSLDLEHETVPLVEAWKRIQPSEQEADAKLLAMAKTSFLQTLRMSNVATDTVCEFVDVEDDYISPHQIQKAAAMFDPEHETVN